MDGPEHALGIEGGLGDEFALRGAVAALVGFAAVGVSRGGRLRRAEGGGRKEREGEREEEGAAHGEGFYQRSSTPP